MFVMILQRRRRQKTNIGQIQQGWCLRAQKFPEGSEKTDGPWSCHSTPNQSTEEDVKAVFAEDKMRCCDENSLNIQVCVRTSKRQSV